MKIFVYLSRIVVGITFIFSGFVKGIDPLGFTYKFTDYFNAMGMEGLIWASFPLSVIMSFLEFAVGVAILLNLFPRLASWLALLFMAYFLPFTLWVALKNPVTDCGCFGDALVISNWETFYKNVILIIFTIVIFIARKKLAKSKKPAFNKITGFAFILIYIVLGVYSYRHLPVLDFRPYKVGVNIPDAMSVPEDADKEIYENIFYYKNKNTGEVEKFDEQNYPWQDTVNWAYENMESILIQEGYEPPIHDFNIETPDGENIIDFFIYDENYVFILVAYDLQKSSLKSQDKINELANWALEDGMSFICLTSTLFDENQAFAEENGAPYEFFNCDEITLKTIIRSNPGLMVIKDGNIIGKWHSNDIPTPEEFQNEFMNK